MFLDADERHIQAVQEKYEDTELEDITQEKIDEV
jgi:hypothetical protein